MPFKLEIEFGGLCMLVQRNDRQHQGLYVLMPVMDMTGMEHVPMLLVCDKRFAGGQRLPAPVRLPRRTVLDWRGFAKVQGQAQVMPPEIPAFPKYAGNKPVNPSWLSGTPSKCLAARVELPLGSTIEVLGKTCLGEVTVDYEDGSGKHTHWVAGEATVRVDVTEESVTTIPVGKDEDGQEVTLTPDNGRLEIKIVSIMRKDLAPPCGFIRRPVDPKKPIEHVQAYYNLLENRCDPAKGGPHLFPTGNMKTKDGRECPPGVSVEGVVRLAFIHPYQCTLGTG